MSKKNKIIIAIAIILICVIAYFLFRKKKQPETLENLNYSPINPAKSTTSITPMPEFPLQMGSKGDNVRRLQFALNRLKQTDKIAEDGVFGNSTSVKLVMTLPTSKYSVGPKVSEAQLTEIIRLGNLI